jgi:soluble lytic murein transglycosylase-like protein
MIEQAAKDHNLEPALLRALVHAESAFSANALSKQGAQGLTQLMPATAKELGVKNAFDPFDNVNGGAKYLAQMLKQFNGDTRLATAVYNAGPNAVKKYQGIPPYKETKVYVERVHILFERYKKLV